MPPSLPGYVRSSVPIPLSSRAPWYKNTFPSYAGVFLWVAFYLGLTAPTSMPPPISEAGAGLCLLALAVAGLICFALYYYAPGMLGMQTGRPLYIVGTSTFGTKGGCVMPGLLMGALQIGWFAVATSVASSFIMQGLHTQSRVWFGVTCVLWAYCLAWIAVKGISYVARVAQYLNWVPLAMIAVIFWVNRHGIASYRPAHPDSSAGFLGILTIVIGFFATAGAAGADFGMNNRNRADVVWGGLTGITLAVVVAGGLPLLAVAGYIGGHGVAIYDYGHAIASVRGLAAIMFFLFAAASVAPTCFCTFIASNSFATMLPRIPRWLSTFVAVTVGMLLAISGAAQHMVEFFTIVGASFGPICGAMAADYLLAGRKWSGPRDGINAAGYVAWAIGFVIGILGYLPGIPASWVKADRPAVLFSFVFGFVIYWILAKVGARPRVIPVGE
jgi:cytosine permease